MLFSFAEHVSEEHSKTPKDVVDDTDGVRAADRGFSQNSHASDPDTEVDAALETLKTLTKAVWDAEAPEAELRASIKALADLLYSPNSSVSSFEFMTSGLVDALLDFCTAEDRKGMDPTFCQRPHANDALVSVNMILMQFRRSTQLISLSPCLYACGVHRCTDDVLVSFVRRTLKSKWILRSMVGWLPYIRTALSISPQSLTLNSAVSYVYELYPRCGFDN